MKKIYIIALAVVILLVCFLVYHFWPGSVVEPQFLSIQNVEIVSSEKEHVEIKAVARFHNPNSFSVQLINTELKVLSHDVSVARISQTELTHVEAQSNFSIPIHFKVDLLKLGLSQTLAGIIEQALNEDRKIDLKMEGYCRIKVKEDILKIPIHYQDEIRFR